MPWDMWQSDRAEISFVSPGGCSKTMLIEANDTVAEVHIAISKELQLNQDLVRLVLSDARLLRPEDDETSVLQLFLERRHTDAAGNEHSIHAK